MLLCRGLVSAIVVLMIGFLGLGVRAFATADATKLIFLAVFVTSVVILALYFVRRRPTRELAAHLLFRESPFVKRSLFSRLYPIDRNPLTLDYLSERPSRVDLAVVKAANDSPVSS